MVLALVTGRLAPGRRRAMLYMSLVMCAGVLGLYVLSQASNAYERMVSEAQHQFLAQTALLMKSLSGLLPFSGKHRPDRD
jgi:hypothetical protein